MSFLFGSILAVPTSDLWVMAALDAVLLALAAFYYRAFLAMSFDPEFAGLRGVPVRFLHFLMLAMIAASVVMIIRVVGLILVIALLTIPPYLAEGRAPLAWGHDGPGLACQRAFLPGGTGPFLRVRPHQRSLDHRRGHGLLLSRPHRRKREKSLRRPGLMCAACDPAQLLAKAGLRATSNRKAVLAIMLEAREALAPRQILQRARRGGGHLDKVTLYRTLDALQRAGLADRHEDGEGPCPVLRPVRPASGPSPLLLSGLQTPHLPGTRRRAPGLPRPGRGRTLPRGRAPGRPMSHLFVTIAAQTRDTHCHTPPPGAIGWTQPPSRRRTA